MQDSSAPVNKFHVKINCWLFSISQVHDWYKLGFSFSEGIPGMVWELLEFAWGQLTPASSTLPGIEPAARLFRLVRTKTSS